MVTPVSAVYELAGDPAEGDARALIHLTAFICAGTTFITVFYCVQEGTYVSRSIVAACLAFLCAFFC